MKPTTASCSGGSSNSKAASGGTTERTDDDPITALGRRKAEVLNVGRKAWCRFAASGCGAVLSLTAAVILSACGGGGGGSGLAARCVPTGDHGCIPPAAYSGRVDEAARGYGGSSEFSNQWGLRRIGADRAYAHLALAQGGDVQAGAGVTVGVIDTGIDTGHWAFTGKTVSEEFLGGATDETGDSPSHVSAVASVIAGRRPGGHAVPRSRILAR